MITYTSKTGYIKRIATGEIYVADIIYLGKLDNVSNYADSTKEEYEAYIEELAKEARENGNND